MVSIAVTIEDGEDTKTEIIKDKEQLKTAFKKQFKIEVADDLLDRVYKKLTQVEEEVFSFEWSCMVNYTF